MVGIVVPLLLEHTMLGRCKTVKKNVAVRTRMLLKTSILPLVVGQGWNQMMMMMTTMTMKAHVMTAMVGNRSYKIETKQ